MSKFLILLPTLNQATGWGRYSSEIVSHLNKRHKLIIEDSIETPRGLRYSPREILSGAKTVRSKLNQVDAVFSLIAYPYSLVAYLGTRLSSVPYFLSAHGSFAVAPLSDIRIRYPTLISFMFAEQIFPVSSFTAEQMRCQAPNLDNLTVISNGISFDTFEPVEPFSLDHDVLLTVGPFKPRKGQALAIQAFAEIADEFPNLEYHLIGGTGVPRYRRKTESIAEKSGLKHRINFEGQVTDTELKRWYESARLLLHTPQYINHRFEGFGLVYLEANRYGTPVVGVKNSGAEQAIDHNRSGLCVENTPEAVASAIQSILVSKKRYNQYVNGAQSWAKANIWTNTIEKLDEELRQQMRKD